MDRYGLIGYPLGHSFSQKYFTEKFAREGIDARYDLFPLERIEDVEKLLAETDGLRGFNVTIPYKEQVMRYLDELDESASSVGAVNVVKVSHVGGRLHLKGYNSDTYGFWESLRPLLKSCHTSALVLGTGGASKAVVGTLRKMGIASTLVSRRKSDGTVTYSELDRQLMETNKLIVNASPVGMSPNVNQCPDIPYELLTPEHLCFDLVYNPEETKFLRQAAEKGAATKNGLQMLHLQAEGAWKYWTSK